MGIHGIGHGHGHAHFGFGRRGFDALDADDDGELTRAELDPAGQKLPAGKNDPAETAGDAAAATPARKFASRWDIHNQIKADMRDLLLASQEERWQARDMRRAERLMDKADEDGDGLLTADELTAFAETVEPGSRMAQRVELLNKYFDAANTDGEDGLSTDEVAGFLGEVRTAYRDYVSGLRDDDAFGQFLSERFGTAKAETDPPAAATTAVTETADPTEETPPAAPVYGRRFGFFGERREMLLKYFDTADADANGGLNKDEVRGFFKEIRGAFKDFVAQLKEQDAFGQFLDARFAKAEPAAADEDGETTTTTTTVTTTTTTTTVVTA